MKASDAAMSLAGLRNLGPRSRQWLSQVGIDSPEQLRAADPFEVYARLKAADPATSLNMLYALIGAQEDLDWRTVQRERRLEILLRLDAMGLAPR